MQPQHWRRAWATKSWMRLLSGLTLPPSTAERGVALWISSLRASRVSPTASPESDQATRTSGRSATVAGRSRMASESSKSVPPPWSSLRTSGPGLLDESSTSANSARSYRQWVIESKRRSLSLRQILAHRMKGNESSSWHIVSPNWATPQAFDATGIQRTAKANINNIGFNLREQVQTPNWVGLKKHLQKKTTVLWQTPASFQGKKRRQMHQTERTELLLPGQAEHWQTPGLDQQARSLLSAWPTAGARDHKGSSKIGARYRTSGTLDEAAEQRFSHQPLTPHTGTTSSKQTRTSPPRLNPAFVNWLQGNVWWWTHPAPTSFGPREIRWWRYRLRQRLSFLLAVLGSSKYRKHT